MQQPQLTLVLILVVVACVWAEPKVESNAEPLQAEESSVDVLADKHQEKRYVGSGYYGSNVDSYYNPYNTRGLGYDTGYSNLGYGAGYGTAGYGGVGYGTAGYGGLGYGTAGYGNAGYGGYAGTGYNNGYNGGYGSGYSGYGGYGAGYGSYNPYYNSRVGTGYAGYRPGYNSYPSSYYSGGYGSSIVGGSLGSLGGAAGIIPPVVPGIGY